jgi:hypothetical protein
VTSQEAPPPRALTMPVSGEDESQDYPFGRKDRADGWVDASRPARWGLALALALGAIAVLGYWMATSSELACQVATVTTATTRTVTRTCGLPDIADFVVVLAAIVVLILPDAQKLKIGGLEFERLSSQVEEQTHEIQRLSQTVSTTVNIGSDLINQARNGFRETKDILDRVREFLPDDGVAVEQLAAMDRLELRIDAESWTDLFAGILTMHGLIEEAKRRAFVGPSEDATVEEEATSEAAEPVISDYLE